MSDHLELIKLQQDVRIISEHQRILGGVIDAVLEDEDRLRLENQLLRSRVAQLESEKAALLASRDELQRAVSLAARRSPVGQAYPELFK